jgi:PAS domain S-box-containing protein
MDLVALLEHTGDPGFVSDQDGRVSVWNAAAEQLLGYPAKSVVGRRCHEVIRGRDLFGNLFCHGKCSLREMVHRKEKIQGFRLAIRSESGETISATCSVLAVYKSKPRVACDIVHLLHLEEAGGHPARVSKRGDGHDAAVEGPSDLPRGPANGGTSLTPRELEVLRLLAEGMVVAEMADLLSVSANTVRCHIQHILTKLEARNQLQAVSRARDCGLI